MTTTRPRMEGGPWRPATPKALLVWAAVLLSWGLARPAQAVVFQAEDYTAYFDATPGNTGGAYRNDGVDIQPTTDGGGGYNVGWIDANEWLAFANLSIPTSGSYTIRFRVASPNGGAVSADLNGGSILLGGWTVPNTGGWQNWQTLSQTVNINAGTYSLGVFATTGGWNLNWVEVVSNTPAGAPVQVYEHCNFGGLTANLQVGSYTLSQLQALGIRNDDVSSLRVASGFRATLYQHHNFTGSSIVKTANDSCLVDDSFNDSLSSVVVSAVSEPPGDPGTANGTHKRLKIINGCGQDMWIQWLTAPGIAFNGPNRHRLSGLGSSVEYDIPDKGLPAMRFWPGLGCDAGGHNCQVGASGGPPNLGFTCPPGGCAPPIDSKFEGTFGCIPGVADGNCAQNPSAPGQPLGRGDWWNASAVDGYTVPLKVQVFGNCPTGPQPAPVFGPGGPPGGVIDCSSLRVFDCPINENLSTDGQFPQLSNVSLLATNPTTGAVGGCYSPSAKLTFSQWAAGFTTYPPDAPQARMYACPTPPITPEQCSSGPADRTAYRNMIHSHCATYAYPYDDGFGLASCPAATNLRYEVTFYCPS
jgi:Carbohydrate binding module (family 6)/Thaumatin family